MGILGVILSWAVIIWIWSLQAKAQVRREQEARLSHAEYIRKVILEGFGKMLGYISKADGHISEIEVNVASKCLRSMGLLESEYQICVKAFNEVKSYSFASFYSCATYFSSVVTQEARMLVYEMLWIVAAADGVLEKGEDELLRSAVDPLNVDSTLYFYFKRMYFDADGRKGADGSPPRSEIIKAYARLGCNSSDSDDTIRMAYRKLAMRYHPDRLKAEGVPDGMVAQATSSMAEINAAWELIRKERKLNG